MVSHCVRCRTFNNEQSKKYYVVLQLDVKYTMMMEGYLTMNRAANIVLLFSTLSRIP